MANRYTKTPVDFVELRRLYSIGMTQSEIGEIMGFSQKLIWRACRDAEIKARKQAPRNQHGAFNNNWKGNSVGYSAFHYRLVATKGRPHKCERCGTNDPGKHYDWANLTGKYDDPSDYQRMCRSCHFKYDDMNRNFKGATGARPAPSKAVMSNA